MNESNVTPETPPSQGESAPPGYRRLELGEVIQDGDMFYFLGQLHPTLKAGIKQKTTEEFENLQYYRFIPQAPTPVTIEGPGPLAPIPGPIDWTRPVRIKGAEWPVRIIAIDHSLTKPVIGIVQGSGASFDSQVNVWHYNGQFHPAGTNNYMDLENVPEVTK